MGKFRAERDMNGWEEMQSNDLKNKFIYSKPSHKLIAKIIMLKMTKFLIV